MEAKEELLLHIGISKTYIQHFIDKQMDIKFLDFAEITIKDYTEIERLVKVACEGTALDTSANGLHLQNVMPRYFKERRQKLRLSMQGVSNNTGISKATISRIERGGDAFFKTVMQLDKFYSDNGA